MPSQLARPHRACRARRVERVLLALLVLLPGCAGEREQPAPAAPVEVRLELAPRLRFADVHHAGARLVLANAASRSRLSTGWYEFEDPESGGPAIWTRGRVAVIEMPLVEPMDRTLRLELDPFPAPHPAEREQDQTVSLVWNGNELGVFELLEKRELAVAVPGTFQRVGPNRLEIQASPWTYSIAPDRQRMGVRLHRLALEPEPPLPRDEEPAARLEGDAILQRPGSVLSFGLELPRRARLVGSVAVAGPPAATAKGRVVVALLDEKGRKTRLFERSLASLADAGPAPLELELGETAPGLGVLSLSVSRGGGATAEGSVVAWDGLRIEGVRAAPPPAPEIARDRYNVLVVLFDSLRADHVDPASGIDVQTPNFARLAASGVSFERARTNASWTRPAMASLLASVPPSVHRIATWEDHLIDSIPSLPEQLRDAGYETAFVTANMMTDPAFGFDRGFELTRLLYLPDPEQQLRYHRLPRDRARFVWDQYLSVLAAQPLALESERKPFFFLLHEIDPHSPYEPPKPYADLYAFGYRGRVTGSTKDIFRIHKEELLLDRADLRQLQALYRGEVSAMDAYLGWLLERLEERQLRERTLVVLVSDHGEEFQEHRGIGHGHTAYAELLRVPLILSLPGVLPEGLRSTADADLMDLAPTILDLVGLEIPEEMRGRSLLPFLWDGGSAPRRPSLAQSHGPRHDALRLGRWKLIRQRAPDSGRGQHGFALYDLATDPGETLDRWPTELGVGIALRQLLAAQLAVEGSEQPRAPKQALDPEIAEQLRALGYGD